MLVCKPSKILNALILLFLCCITGLETPKAQIAYTYSFWPSVCFNTDEINAIARFAHKTDQVFKESVVQILQAQGMNVEIVTNDQVETTLTTPSSVQTYVTVIKNKMTVVPNPLTNIEAKPSHEINQLTLKVLSGSLPEEWTRCLEQTIFQPTETEHINFKIDTGKQEKQCPADHSTFDPQHDQIGGNAANEKSNPGHTNEKKSKKSPKTNCKPCNCKPCYCKPCNRKPCNGKPCNCKKPGASELSNMMLILWGLFGCLIGIAMSFWTALMNIFSHFIKFVYKHICNVLENFWNSILKKCGKNGEECRQCREKHEQLQDKAKTIKALESTIKNLLEETQTQNQQIQSQQSMIEDLKKKIDDQTTRQKPQQQETSSLQSTGNRLDATDWKTEYQNIREEAKACKENNASLQVRINMLSEEAKACKEKNASLQVCINMLSRNNETLQNSIHVLSKENRTLGEKLQRCE
jgi:hypothetical protein